MGHAGGHPAQGGDFFRLHQLVVGGLQFLVHLQDLPEVGKDADAAHLLAPLPDDGGGEVHRTSSPSLLIKVDSGGVQLVGGANSLLRMRRIISAATGGG